MTTFTPPRISNEIRTGAAHVDRPRVPQRHEASASRTNAPVAPVVFLDPVTPRETPATDLRRAARDEDALRPLRTPFMADATGER
ncbi:hypothetical protein [Saccharopolyspora dendranthemae]|uniref:Uncharacterized protein n=1 Tax=Saccharopolyspora dendranthemae TaxID=1181886 RepID=A0A561U4P5_9PSEU|nr:hypothetical protein [Saccharopolyspora dendranthemae]TWF94327.1 hypothetical protein FHU35_1328 [Saccharopolyspora dendranthemae]